MKLASAGFDMRSLSIVGKAYHVDEKVIGFYFGGLFLTIPIVGHVVVLGYLTAAVISGLEGAAVNGALEQDDIAFAQPSCSRCLFDRVISDLRRFRLRSSRSRSRFV